MSKKILFKRAIREYEFLKEDLEDIKSLYDNAASDFFKELTEHDKNGILDSHGVEKAAQDWHASLEDEDAEREERDVNFKKLFRKVVAKSHPDRLQNMAEKELSWYVNIYEAAVEANETENWALLISSAIKLDIEIPKEAEDYVEDIFLENEALKEESNRLLSTPAWQWYHIEDEAVRKKLIQNHLNFLKSLNKNQ